MGTAGHGQSMTMLRTLLLALLLALIAAPVASAQGVVGEAADALASDPVYVDRSAERALSDEEADALRSRIEERNAGPLYVAVLHASATNEGGGSGGGSDGGGSGIGAALLLPLLALGGGALLLSRRRRRKAEESELAELKENVRDDLVALGDDIRALDLDV